MGNKLSLEQRLEEQRKKYESLKKSFEESERKRIRAAEVQVSNQQEKYESLKESFEESEKQRAYLQEKNRQELDTILYLLESEKKNQKSQKEIYQFFQRELDEKIHRLKQQHQMDMEQQSKKHQDGIDKIERDLASKIERELADKIEDLKRDHDQKIDQLLKQQEEKIEETKKIIYEEFRQKQLKEAEDRKKFKEEYPIPKFLNPDVINVAITGPSGAGKSTLVNLLRGIKYGEEGEAKTDVNECTFEPISYTFAKTHPLHNIVYLWDLPGAGTAAFPQETYIQKMGIRWYDAVIVVGDTRVRDVDVNLMEELKRTLVRFVYVRTKMDNQVEANQLKNIDPEQTFKKVRENLNVNNNIQAPYLIGLKYILIKGLQEWENADFVELKKVLQIMCAESAEDNKKQQLFKSITNNDSKFDALII